MTGLYVAAGGGGDALAAAIVHRALRHDEPAVIATYAWDRLAVDPVPGPRGAADFAGLHPLGRHNHVVTSTSVARPPSRSTLPRLAGDLAGTLVLLDPSEGATGMRAQLAELVDVYQPDEAIVVDVGGDAVASGNEDGLRSPLGDALTLAAATGLRVPTILFVAGPGLDGELSEARVLDITGRVPQLRLGADDVEPFSATFDWHPSEATALLVAAARGIRGRVEIRDAGLPVELTDNSAGVFPVQLTDALDHNPLARALAGTVTLAKAEEITRSRCGFSEIDDERAKRRRRDSTARHHDGTDLDAAIAAFEREAAARGVEYVTFRRIAEAVAPASIDPADVRRHLRSARPDRYEWPLWSLATSSSRHQARSRAN